jgi:hypothetical protein
LTKKAENSKEVENQEDKGKVRIRLELEARSLPKYRKNVEN